MRDFVRRYRYARHPLMLFCSKRCCRGSVKHGGRDMGRVAAVRFALSDRRVG